MNALAAPGAVAGPWQRRDLIVLGALEAVGFVLLALSWLGVSGTTTFSRQVAWVNVGGAGLLAVILGCALWVHRGRRQVGSRLGFTALVHRPERVAGLTGPASTSDTFVSAVGMNRYHRPDCQAVTGKSVITAGAASFEVEGRRPCGLCCGGHPHTPEVEP